MSSTRSVDQLQDDLPSPQRSVTILARGTTLQLPLLPSFNYPVPIPPSLIPTRLVSFPKLFTPPRRNHLLILNNFPSCLFHLISKHLPFPSLRLSFSPPNPIRTRTASAPITTPRPRPRPGSSGPIPSFPLKHNTNNPNLKYRRYPASQVPPSPPERHLLLPFSPATSPSPSSVPSSLRSRPSSPHALNHFIAGEWIIWKR